FRSIIVHSYQEVYALADEHQTDLRTAAYMISIQRITEAMEARGWI
nr:glutamate dehydrogenase [Bacillota bacterium]